MESKDNISLIEQLIPHHESIQKSYRDLQALIDKNNMTIAEEKARIKEVFYSGKMTTCACCSQKVKYYPRSITSSAARILISLYKTVPKDQFEHINVFGRGLPGVGGGDFSKIRFWGFIEEMPNHTISKKTSGMWRITESGREFCRRNIKTPKHAYMYNAQCWNFSKEEVDIVDCLGAHFDYNELMKEF